MHLISKVIHSRLTSTNQTVGRYERVGQWGVAVPLKVMKFVLFRIENRRQVNLASIKLDLLRVYIQQFTRHVVYLPVGVWLAVRERAPKYQDPEASHRECYCVVNWFL